MLRPIPVALVSCTRYFEAMSAMRESFTNLQKARLGPSRSLSKDPSRRKSPTGSECVTPRSSGNVSSSDDLDLTSPKMEGVEKQQGEDETDSNVDDRNDRKLSWPSDNEDSLYGSNTEVAK